MLNGSHVILYAKDAEKTRAFFRDTLDLRHVSAGEGWLIFALPPAELGIHPDDVGGKHQLFLMCDDVEKTRVELTAKGVKFTQPVTNQGWGLVTAFDVPGMGELWMYEPRHPTTLTKPAAKKKAASKKSAPKKKPARGAKAKKRAPARRRR